MSFELDEAVIQGCVATRIRQVSPINGGDTHRCYRVELTDRSVVFAKVNDTVFIPVLASEALSLKSLHTAGAHWYPTVLAQGQNTDGAALILDYRELSRIEENTAVDLGRLLAHQHQLSSSQFGWHHDNHIGLSTQSNKWHKSWLEFFQHERLIPQFESAIANHLNPKLVRQVEKVILDLADYVDDTQSQPRLLHGDLWAGNCAFEVPTKTPLLFDPAPYYGDAEADLAMTRLFSPFAPEFYAAYDEIIAPQPGASVRASIYNLYHALNHFNLFGHSYTGLVAQCLKIDR